MRGASFWVTLTRPEAFNALSPAIISGLNAALDQVETNKDIRALVLTGTGKAFCAGADLKTVPQGMTDDETALHVVDFLADAASMYSRLARLHVPTIAAINGLALAGGTELLLCCDYVVADIDAKFGEGHAKFGQLPGGGGSVRLPRRIGSSRAKYLMFTGEVITATQALAWNLVDEVVPNGTLEERVDAIVSAISDKSSIVLKRMKTLVLDSADQPLDLALHAEISMSALHATSYDRQEGLAAFVEKRQPIYKGY